jgi:hypothetical protein
MRAPIRGATALFGIAWLACAGAIGRAQQSPTITASARAEAVDRLARSLETLYVVPALGDSLARHVRRRLASRAYDSLATPRAFADALSQDLASIAHDLHLWVRYFPPMAMGARPVDLDETWLNHGFPDVRVLDGNVGYVDVRSFTQNPEAARALASAMALLVDCDALIVDLRNNGGGTMPAMVGVASYLFGDSVHLADLYWRDQRDTIRVWTRPQPVGSRLDRQPVFVLTSRRTFSAAEAFAASLQDVHRAKVVGETTRGGAHSGKGLQDLGADLRALVPSGETLGPTSRTNWEGVGVRPDVAAPDSTALRVAHRLALVGLLDAAAAGPRRDRLERALRALR